MLVAAALASGAAAVGEGRRTCQLGAVAARDAVRRGASQRPDIVRAARLAVAIAILLGFRCCCWGCNQRRQFAD